MLKKWKLFLLLICVPFYGTAQLALHKVNNISFEERNESVVDEDSQSYLFSQLFGFNIDQITNPKIWEFTADWLKVHYRYGGDSKEGIDCSGFAKLLYQYCYKTLIGNSSSAIRQQNDSYINKDDLKEGDLVFFKIRKGRVSHVGVYLGNNKFVHASVQSGVIISDLNEPYYLRYYHSATRVINNQY